MQSRYRRHDKKEAHYGVTNDVLIERLRKTRALNCKPSDVGMDSYLDWMSKYGRAYFLIGRMY